jgi:hypothetical protein
VSGTPGAPRGFMLGTCEADVKAHARHVEITSGDLMIKGLMARLPGLITFAPRE